MRRLAKWKCCREFALCVCAVSLLVACASLQRQVTVGAGKGEEIVHVKASNFRFEPDNLRAHTGDEIVFRVENISGSSHNMTIRSPGGKVLHSVEIPPGETVGISLRLSEAGEYNFFCNKPFHAIFGMKGKIEVTGR